MGRRGEGKRSEEETAGAAPAFPWMLAAAVVALGTAAMLGTLWMMPPMKEEELGRMHLPRTWSDVQALRTGLDSYAQAHLAATLACFLMIYILYVAGPCHGGACGH